MDEMKIVSKFTTVLISKIARTVIKKKLGYEIGIKLNELHITNTDGKTHLHLSADAELSKEELLKLISDIGI